MTALALLPSAPGSGVLGGKGGGSILYGGGCDVLPGTRGEGYNSAGWKPSCEARGCSSSATIAILSVPAAARYCAGVGAFESSLSGSGIVLAEDRGGGEFGIRGLCGCDASLVRCGDVSAGL